MLAQSVRRFPTLSRCFLATMRASRFECPKASKFARVLSGMNPLPQQTWIDEIPPRAQNVAPKMLLTHVKPEVADFDARPVASQLFYACALQHCLVACVSDLFVHVCNVLHQGRPHVLLFALDLPTLGFTNRSGVPLLGNFEAFHESSFWGR